MGTNNTWTIEEIKTLERELDKGRSYQEIATILGRPKNGVAIKAQRLYRDKYGKRVESKKWTDDEVDLLNKYIQQGKSSQYIAKKLHRSLYSVTVKAQKLGLYFKSSRCKYRQPDLDQLREDWQSSNLTMKTLAKRYNRSTLALKILAQKRKWGPRNVYTSELTIKDIVECVGISRDRVAHWLKMGLSYSKGRSGMAEYYIRTEDLLEFMKDHQDLWDATKVDTYLFLVETPDWFTKKYYQDKENNKDNWHREYTDKEDRQILSLYKQGFDVEYIAKTLKRTKSGIKTRLMILSEGKMSPKYYTEQELQVLRNNSAYMPVNELIDLLYKINPRIKRTRTALEAKCKELGLEYHYTQKRCKQRV